MKTYFITLALTLFLQFFISFYTTNRLVIQNQKYQNNTEKFNQLKKNNQQLQNQYTLLTSKTHLKKEVDKLKLYPIQKNLNIKQ